MEQGTDESRGVYAIDDMRISPTELFRMSPISPALCWIGGPDGPVDGDPVLLFPTTTFAMAMQLLHDREWLIYHGWQEPDPIKLEPEQAFRFLPRSQWYRLILTGQCLQLGDLLPEKWVTRTPEDISDDVEEPGITKFLELWKSAPDFSTISSSDITARTADQII